MVEESNVDRIARLKNSRARTGTPEEMAKEVLAEAQESRTIKGRLKRGLGKLKQGYDDHLAPYVKIAGVVAALGAGWLTYDYVSKRQNVAERNVIYRTSHTFKVAGNKEKKAAEKADRESITQVQEGGGIESKVGTYLTDIHRETRGDIEYYKMFNTQQRRIAATDQKPETFQAGWSWGGSINFKEQFAELIVEENGLPSKDSDKYMVYKYDPERGWKKFDIDVVEFPVNGEIRPTELGIVETDFRGKKDKRVMVNRLVENRNLLGWFLGKFYRDGTLLEEFVESPENRKLSDEFFKAVRAIDSPESIDTEVREDLANQLVDLTNRMKKQPVYATFEDGFLKLLPQESTMYLGENPGNLQRFAKWLGFNRDESEILRIENSWDLFPGSWRGFKWLNLGSGKDRNFLFDKYNNGGYSLEDRFGTIARIDIEDFFLSYGSDVVYHYYADLNGNGKIDRPNKLLNLLRPLFGKPKVTYDEHIGSVLGKPTHDEIVELEKLAKGTNPESDISLTSNYSFMAPPTSDMKNAMQYFQYGAYIESMMPDQIHRGFGQHSVLGFINDQRSDIMLFNDLTVENLSRALTQESTLVAKYDVINLLNATHRPYAKDLAEKYGIASDFEGQFVSNPDLKEKMYFGPWPWIAAGALAYGIRRGKKKFQRNKEDPAVSSRIKAISERRMQ